MKKEKHFQYGLLLFIEEIAKRHAVCIMKTLHVTDTRSG